MKNPIYLLLLLATVLIPKFSAHAEDLQSKLKVLKERIKVEQANFPKGDLENIEYVKKILNQMSSLDQEVRMEAIKDSRDTGIVSLMEIMDKFHTTQMKQILEKHGWITISKFGKKVSHQAWLLVQHADHDIFFQAGCLFVLSNLADKGEVAKSDYAYLYDRVALKFQNLGMKQRYGTQATSEFKLQPYEGTIQELNQRRAEMGMEPVEKYLEGMKKLYGE